VAWSPARIRSTTGPAPAWRHGSVVQRRCAPSPSGMSVSLMRSIPSSCLGCPGRRPSWPGAEPMVWLDLDYSVIQTSGYAKQAAGRGYTGVKGLNALVATASTPLAAPVIAATRLRRGNARSFGERPPWSPRRCRSPAAVEPVDRLFFAPIRRSIPAPWSPRPTRPEPDSVSPPRSTHR
jgi:hypothetical protein